MVSGLCNLWCIRLIFRSEMEPFVLVVFLRTTQKILQIPQPTNSITSVHKTIHIINVILYSSSNSLCFSQSHIATSLLREAISLKKMS